MNLDIAEYADCELIAVVNRCQRLCTSRKYIFKIRLRRGIFQKLKLTVFKSCAQFATMSNMNSPLFRVVVGLARPAKCGEPSQLSFRFEPLLITEQNLSYDASATS